MHSHPILEDHMFEPLEVQWFKSRKNKQRVFFIILRLLYCSLWIRNPHGGFGAYILTIAAYWCLI